MFTKFARKPQILFGFQFTKKMHEDLIALGKDYKENPIPVKVRNIPDAETEWNWHIQQLYIYTIDGVERVNVGDWIMKETFRNIPHFFPVTKSDLNNKFYEA